MNHWFQILLASFGAGIGAECFRRFRDYKHSRRALAPEVRNAGFWTDGRLIAAETLVWTLLIVPPAYFLIVLLAADRLGLDLPLP